MDPSKVTSSFVETVLHEGSHLLYLFDASPIRDKIYFRSEALNVQFPRNLWHASMFYLCGRATQDELQKLGVQHEMIMDVNNIFSKYNAEEFRETNEERSHLEEVVNTYKEYKEIKATVEEAKDILKNEKDEDLREMAKEDISQYESQLPSMEEKLKVLLLPKDPVGHACAVLRSCAAPWCHSPAPWPRP